MPAWIAIYAVVLVWSGFNPKDYFTWILEVAPAIIGLVALAATYNSFRLTKLVYVLILVLHYFNGGWALYLC